MKKITSLFLAFIMLVTSLSAFGITAFAEEGDKVINGVTYTYDTVKGGVSIVMISSNKKKSDISIPSKINGKSVVQIDTYIDENISGDIVIPNSVKTIVAIFTTKNLGTLKIGKNVSKIDVDALSIGNFASYKVDSRNKNFVSKKGVLFTADESILFSYPVNKADKEYTVPKSVKTIGMYAFAWTQKLKTLNIGDNVANLMQDSFRGSAVSKINIGKGVKNIEGNIFATCNSLKGISVNKDNKKYSSKSGVLFNKDKTVLINYPANKSSKEYSVPKTVKTIGMNAFGDNHLIKKIKMGDNVTKIGASAFENCLKLSSVSTPKKLTSIGEFAYSCTGIKSIKIPKTVTKIGYGAFSGCVKLASVDMSSAKIKKIEEGTFSDTAIKSFNIPKTVTSIGISAFSYTKLESITIPSNVKKLGEFTFYGCSKLTSVTVPAGIKTIKSYTFDGCNALTSLTIKGKDTVLKEYCIPFDYDEREILDENGNVIDWAYDLVYPKTLTIKAPKDSKAQSFAKKNNIKFKTL